MRRILSLAAVGAIAASGVALTGPAEAVAPHASTPRATSMTDFSLQAAAFGTKVTGGTVPVHSGRTAFSYIGCTRKSGRHNANDVVTADLGGLATAQVVHSRTWTTRKNGVVASHARNRIAHLQLLPTPAGAAATVNGIVARTKSWHNKSGFHSRAVTKVASIKDALGGDLGLPTKGNPVVIPGVVRIALGYHKTSHGSSYAQAKAVSLRIKLLATNTRILAGYAYSRIDGGATNGIFHGYANGSRVKALDGTIESGRTSLLPMPCPGTGGNLKTTDTIGVDLPGIAHLNGVRSAVKGTQNDKRGDISGFTRSKIARARFDVIGKRTLVINAIVARANVRLTDGGMLRKNAKGTAVGKITVGNKTFSIGADGVLRIKGLAKIQAPVVHKSKRGIDVTGIKVTLLGGAQKGVVVWLAHAKLSITRS